MAAVLTCVVMAVAVYWLFIKVQYETVLEDWENPRVSADGRDIAVTYVGGVCGTESSEVRLDEATDRVELTVVTRREITHEDCPDVGVLHTITAHLTQPLGDRRLVDGHCAHPEWGTTYGCSGH